MFLAPGGFREDNTCTRVLPKSTYCYERRSLMPEINNSHPNRRSILKSSMAMLAWSALARKVDAQEPAMKHVNHASSPSTLKITDMRFAVVVKPGPSPCVLI